MAKIYEIVERAIEKLHDGKVGKDDYFIPANMWSCHCIYVVILEVTGGQSLGDPETWALWKMVMGYLSEFGLDPDGSNCFVEFENPIPPYLTPKSQEARALWLTWIAMIAREEDV